MSFDRPWALFLLLFPLAWMAWEWRKHFIRKRLSHTRTVHLVLKAVTFVLVILAISAPSVMIHESRVAVAVLADTSASVSDADLARENSLIGQIIGAHSASQVLVLPFARTPRPLTPSESAARLSRTTGPDGRATNLEAPLRQALASLPPGMLHRITLITDGNENAGSITRAAWQAQQLGIPVDTIALAGRQQPLLKTEAVGLPGSVFTGERFPVDLTVTSPRAVTATVELTAEGKSLGAHPVSLEPGENRVRIRTSLNAAGAIDLGGKISAPGLGESRFENAIAVRKPQIDWISEDPAGTEGHIVDVLTANKFNVVESKALPASLDGAQMVVFNNINTDALPDADKTRVESFVQNGGGALMLAGENTVYVEHKDKSGNDQPEDALARTFPAKIAPPRSPQGTAVVLVIDKSSSMEGRKMDMARLAAVGVVENLKEDDRIGILIFDNSFVWEVPLRRADNKTLIKRQISGIQADGGTQIAPALEDAYHKILATDAAYRHIVLLTDGISEEGDSLGLARDASNNHVTISTIGLGQDVNRQYLEKIAANAGGKSYLFSNDPQGLEQIVLKDVQEHSGTTAVEKPIRAEVKQASDLLDKVDVEHAPPLAGYVRFEARPSADEILATANVDKDPLLVRWQYGLGRAAIFASDAKSRWAASWLTWSGFDRLWTNVFRDLLPRGNESEAAARYDGAAEDLVVDYHLSAHSAEPATPPALFVIGPGDFRKPVEVSRVSPGNYQARVRIGATEGLFRVRPVEDSNAFPEVGLYRQESELSDYGSNTTLLKSIAQATGGRFNPDVRQLFDSGGRSIITTLRLWPGLLAFAILLNLIELTLRKWRGIMETFRSFSGQNRRENDRLAA